MHSHYRHIIAAIDFSALTAQVIARAKQLSQENGCGVELLHVVEIPTYPVLEDIAVMGLPGLWDEAIAKNALEYANKKINDLANQTDMADFKVMVGNPSREILAYAKHKQADLIIVGSHGTQGWKQLMGSTSHSLINQANCDVLVVRAKEEKDIK